MSKAILVIDMPKCCKECDLIIHGTPVFCAIKLKDIKTHDRYVEKPDWCPLRPMPEKKEELNLNYILAEAKSREEVADGVLMSFMIDGYNACIDEIGGGANETDKETNQSP